MKHFILYFVLLFFSFKMYGQNPSNNQTNCQTGISIQVFSSSTTNIVLGNAAPFLFVPSVGQLTSYILTEVGTSSPFAQQTVSNTPSNTNNTFNFQLPPSVTTTDLIDVEMTVTNTNGHVCFVKDTLEWANIGNPTFPVFRWRNVLPSPGNFGTFSSSPLPVEWVSFDGKCNQGDTYLSWSTASEINNEGYAVQVATENNSWETIGFLKGKGNTSDLSYYNFVHQNAPKERIYYKLIQVDYDGRTNESKIIYIDNANQELVFNDFEIYPNPSNGQITIDLGSTPFDSFDLNIYNSIGQTIRTLKQKDINNPIISLTLPEQGLYFIHINMDGNEQTKCFIIE
jgi:hypothetical protein